MIPSSRRFSLENAMRCFSAFAGEEMATGAPSMVTDPVSGLSTP